MKDKEMHLLDTIIKQKIAFAGHVLRGSGYKWKMHFRYLKKTRRQISTRWMWSDGRM